MNHWVNCPHCGAEISESASFCKHCGSSDEDGWREVDSSSFGDDDFDYDSFVESEFGERGMRSGFPWVWQLISILLLISFSIGLLFL